MEITEALNLMDDFVKLYADRAIDEKGGANYQHAPRQFFKIAAQDHHLRNPGWMITYSQGNRSTDRTSIGEHPEMETIGNLRVTFSLAGRATKDDSRRRKDQQQSDNWGTRQFESQEAKRRYEQQTCRGVAVRFADLIQTYCNVRQLFITDFDIDDNLPHVESSNLIWWPITVNISWKLWWQKRGA